MDDDPKYDAFIRVVRQMGRFQTVIQIPQLQA
jgi:hypothetical protein